jgi:pimeloyl-ACP methyl ester carboxylesterase
MADVVPLLSDYHEVFTPNALGHRGGPTVRHRPATIWDVVDAAETYLDEQGLSQPHLAGNSMGGFVALELARRGRAATACAISPGVFWSTGDGTRPHASKALRTLVHLCRVSRPTAPLIFKSSFARRTSLRFLACARYGDRIPASQFVEIVDSILACTVGDEVFSADEQQFVALHTAPCPVTVAWAEKDSLLPLHPCGAIACERLPAATFEILPDVGHVPMVDDPKMVARTILASTGAIPRQR